MIESLKSMKVSVSTTIEKELRDSIDRLADSRGLLRAFLVRESIRRGFVTVLNEFNNGTAGQPVRLSPRGKPYHTPARKPNPSKWMGNRKLET
jgi:hypothetical protein